MAPRAAIARVLVCVLDILPVNESFGVLDPVLRLRQRVVVSFPQPVIVPEADSGRIRAVIKVGLGRSQGRDDPHMVCLKRQCFNLIPGQLECSSPSPEAGAVFQG